MDNFVILSGCSGGGKSTLLGELSHRGYATIKEPGRRIVAEQAAIGGSALPWVDPIAFARRAVEMALEDRRKAADESGWIFFDRGLIDAASALQHFTHGRVFLTPPWPEIYRNDADRKHGLDDAIAEYDRLLDGYALLGYELVLLPKIGVERRADYVLDMLGR